MNIHIKYFLSNGQSPTTLTLVEGATLKQVREVLHNEKDLLMVNGVVRQNNHLVSPDDTIVIMPVLQGG
jgi:molybdopterin converting factor small subunit